MKSIFIWFILTGAVLLFGNSVDAWNRQLYNRYSRNLFRNDDISVPTSDNSVASKFGSQQAEIYGIVEPLPCLDRLCNVNDDCCPASICVKTYGDGKCIYAYGRKRDLCHRNTDCEFGMMCLKDTTGHMRCQSAPQLPLKLKQTAGDCVSSNDCNLAKGMCCQLQRSKQHVWPKKICTYVRDPFMCIDIMLTEGGEIREQSFPSPFNQRRM